jgi:hypothetical protein
MHENGGLVEFSSPSRSDGEVARRDQRRDGGGDSAWAVMDATRDLTSREM